MKKQLTLKVKPSEATDDNYLKKIVAVESGCKVTEVTGYTILRKSIDARSRQVYVNLSIEAFIKEPYHHRSFNKINFGDVTHAKKCVIIIGAGPAGLFAALQLIEKGIKCVILERGKDVKSRRRDLAVLNKEGVINPESNYCFGEGGAGTYSDGKLYTRSTKRGDVTRILNLLVQFGADEKILYEAHPHIGTNKLPQIITAIRKQIIESGGEFLFEKKVIDLKTEDGLIKKVITADGATIEGDAVILATGHSARDIFLMLHEKKIKIEVKPFALGVRVEHPQALIDSVQYHCLVRGEFLPPSSYSLVQQVDGKGVFSFCMCPGGIIAPAATNPNELVVNGWSPSKRNNPFANSGMVVQVELSDVIKNVAHPDSVGEKLKIKNDALAMMHFQQLIERRCFDAGGGKFVAPAQRMADFSNGKLSA